ncbi:MAG: GH39 family glycosyl hydrolase [Caldisericia bacterium]
MFKDIIEKGFEVYFRLGNSYSNSPSPKNFTNWIKVALHIVDHYYNLSKSLNKPIKYVEIWNEPDNKTFWDRPKIDYFKLYVNSAKEIKKLYPELKVGGAAFTPQFALTTNGKKLTDDFLKYVKEKF